MYSVPVMYQGFFICYVTYTKICEIGNIVPISEEETKVQRYYHEKDLGS